MQKRRIKDRRRVENRKEQEKREIKLYISAGWSPFSLSR
jgi:hypothetical protein